MLDLIIIGAGPIGLEAAIRAKRAGLRYRVLEKGALVDAIYRYPTYMTFFTTSERLEIGGHPLVTATDKPTRKEALDYYRKVAHAEALEIEAYTKVTALRRDADGFEVTAAHRDGEPRTLRSRFVALATGYFDHPNRLGVPGEDLPHVSHYYDEAHPYYGQEVTIVGAGSSAADAALDLFRAGARVTMVHRGDDFRHSLKYWIRPNLENRVKEGSIVAHFRTEIEEIRDDAVIATKDGRRLTIPAERVFLLTGYHAAGDLLDQVGAVTDEVTLAAELDEQFQTTVPGLYCIGSAGFGRRTSDVFIENGLVHAEVAITDVAQRAGTPADA
ncbi:MAG: YpdA family putative bacillithiol disulfide reductase [Trueperaceae bacterium]|nr:YpdA family putative bacillithiol disulfide reductase [Trueperaceae bacterium]